MVEDVILDSYSLCSLNHCKSSVLFLFPIFLTKHHEIPNSMGMGHVPKILEKIPAFSMSEAMAEQREDCKIHAQLECLFMLIHKTFFLC